MKIIIERPLKDFDFWSGGNRNAQKLSNAELYEVESMLEELYPNGINETQLNNIFWFDFDMIRSWLGYPTEE